MKGPGTTTNRPWLPQPVSRVMPRLAGSQKHDPGAPPEFQARGRPAITIHSRAPPGNFPQGRTTNEEREVL